MNIKQLTYAALLLSISVIGSLFAIEGLLRLKNAAGTNYDIEMWRYAKELKIRSENPLLGHEHVASSEARLQNVVIRTNADGLRGGPPRADAQRRILLLGSSITLGWGVPEEATFAALLAEKFRAEGVQVEILNAGIGNYNAPRYVERFLTRLVHLKPTDIVVHYFLRDAEELDAGGGNWLLRNSQLAVTVWTVANRIFGRTGEASLNDWYQGVYDDKAQGYRDMLAALDRLKAFADANGIRVLVAMQPDVHNLVDYPFHYIHQRVEELAKARGFRYVDLLPGFLGLPQEKIWALPGDPHPNALGHQIIADQLYPALRETK